VVAHTGGAGRERGLPVVAPSVGGIPKVVVDGTTGLLVEPENPVVLAEAISVLARDPARRRSLGDAGKTRVREAFHVTRYATELTSVYEDLIADEQARLRWRDGVRAFAPMCRWGLSSIARRVLPS